MNIQMSSRASEARPGTHSATAVRHEAMRIAGKRVETDQTIEVLNPYRSEEHTSELQSRSDLVCRLLLEKKKKTNTSDDPDAAPPQPSRAVPGELAPPAVKILSLHVFDLYSSPSTVLLPDYRHERACRHTVCT